MRGERTSWRRPVAGAFIAAAMAIVGTGLFPGVASAADEDTDSPTTNPTTVAIVMPLTAPITTDSFVDSETGTIHSGSFLSAATLERYTQPGGQLAVELDAAINRGVTLGIDPMVIASIRRLGTTAPPSAVGWLDRLSSVTNETFALTYADSDITAPLQAGRDTILPISSLDFAIDPTLFATSTDPDATPPPSDDTGTVPTSSDLIAWNYSFESLAWPQADTMITSDLPDIAASGYSTTLLASKNVSRSSSSSASAKIDGHAILVADETISSLLGSALAAETDNNWDSAMDALAAAIRSYAQRADGTTLVLTTDRTEELPTARLAQTFQAVQALDDANVVPLGQIAAEKPSKATVVDQPQSKTRVDRVEMLLRSAAQDRVFSGIAETPALITGERRARLLVTLSPAAVRHAGGWFAATEEFLRESSDLRSTVQLVPGGDVLLLADNKRIGISVLNGLDQPVTVYVTVKPSSPIIAVEDDRVPVTIAGAGAQEQVEVPVQALSNGEVELRISLHSEDTLDTRIGEPTVIGMSVRAGWEGPVTVVGGILVVLLFIFGIIRSLLRRRAANRELAAELATGKPTTGD